MLLETTAKVKFIELQARLDERAPGLGRILAMGCLESLWHFAAQNAPDGAVGRAFSDAQIEAGIGWPAKLGAGQLIRALCGARWLDKLPRESGRLYVHDWHEHAPQHVHRKLARNGLLFASGKPPRIGELSKSERRNFEAMAGVGSAYPTRSLHVGGAEQSRSSLDPPLPLTSSSVSRSSADRARARARKSAGAHSRPGEKTPAGNPAPRTAEQAEAAVRWLVSRMRSPEFDTPHVRDIARALPDDLIQWCADHVWAARQDGRARNVVGLFVSVSREEAAKRGITIGGPNGVSLRPAAAAKVPARKK